jgi:hypothetical protein
MRPLHSAIWAPPDDAPLACAQCLCTLACAQCLCTPAAFTCHSAQYVADIAQLQGVHEQLHAHIPAGVTPVQPSANRLALDNATSEVSPPVAHHHHVLDLSPAKPAPTGVIKRSRHPPGGRSITTAQAHTRQVARSAAPAQTPAEARSHQYMQRVRRGNRNRAWACDRTRGITRRCPAAQT